MLKINLQLFADGGSDGAGAGAGSASVGNGSGAASSGVNGSPEPNGEDLSSVIYGVSSESVAGSDETTDTNTTSVSKEDKHKAFDNMIKKNGEYADEFNQRMQSIIDKRFKETKNLEAQLASQNKIMQRMALKYGVDANDIDGLSKAIDQDDSLLEDAAFKEGLTTKQYKEKLELMQENQALKEAEAQARQRQHADEIYAGWTKDAENLVAKYGLQNFDFEGEMQNPDMTSLLANGIPFEAAYKAIHIDDMIGGAMAQTAATVEQKVANRIASRQSRPAENATMSSNTNTMKSDVNKLTNADIDEVLRRVRAGDTISFGNTYSRY